MMRFLGTGAAETLPNPFCNCPVCEGVRRDGPAYYKKRSCFQVSDALMIDFGPDVIAAAHEYGVSLCGLRHILFTHSHDDHLSLTNLSLIGMSNYRFPAPIELYFSPEAYAWVCQNIRAYNPDFRFAETGEGEATLTFGNGNAYHLQTLACGKTYSIAGCQVTPLRSTHPAWGEGEWAWNYRLILPDGRCLFYACDTGRLRKETLDALASTPIDILILECTFGSRRMEAGCGHLDAHAFLDTLQAMRARSLLTPESQVFSTHLNHKHAFTPLMLQAFFDRQAPCHVTVARDGDVVL